MCPSVLLFGVFLFVLMSVGMHDATLTHNGLPQGQTIAPRGIDYLHYTLSKTAPLRRRKKGKGVGKRPRRRLRHTLASTSPFYTLRDSACSRASVVAVRDDEGWVGVVRTVTARELAVARGASVSSSGGTSSSNSGLREPLFVLFHGGRHCEWSRKFWRVWVNATRQLRGNCLVAINGASDSMMNYNLMVLGFPTVMRVRGDESSETFRANRSVEDLIAWVVNAGGVAPLGGDVSLSGDASDENETFNNDRCSDEDGSPNLRADSVWISVLHLIAPDGAWKGDVIDLREHIVRQTQRFNWPLLGANLVCAAHIVWGIVSLIRSVKDKRTEQPEQPQDPPAHEEPNQRPPYFQ